MVIKHRSSGRIHDTSQGAAGQQNIIGTAAAENQRERVAREGREAREREAQLYLQRHSRGNFLNYPTTQSPPRVRAHGRYHSRSPIDRRRRQSSSSSVTRYEQHSVMDRAVSPNRKGGHDNSHYRPKYTGIGSETSHNSSPPHRDQSRRVHPEIGNLNIPNIHCWFIHSEHHVMLEPPQIALSSNKAEFIDLPPSLIS